MASFYCEPEWHRKAEGKTKADFHIQPNEEEPTMDPGFACCERHAGKALRVMLSRFKSVKVRDVSGRS